MPSLREDFPRIKVAGDLGQRPSKTLLALFPETWNPIAVMVGGGSRTRKKVELLTAGAGRGSRSRGAPTCQTLS